MENNQWRGVEHFTPQSFAERGPCNGSSFILRVSANAPQDGVDDSVADFTATQTATTEQCVYDSWRTGA